MVAGETRADQAERQHAVVGTRPVRPDGVDKVTGRARYGADEHPAGMVYGEVLRSPHAHARIRRIDTSKAEALPGVLAVITGADFPDIGNQAVPTIRGPIPKCWNQEALIARDRALFKGHAVAAVAAVDSHTAEDAIHLIEVEYEPLTPVLNIPDALSPDAPLLFDPAETEHIPGLFDPFIEDRHSNMARHLELRLGDVEQGFGESDVVIEREFTTASAHQGYIEPHASTAYWSPDGHLQVWTCTQGAFPIRSQVAEALAIPASSVTVVPTEIGGGFGGKLGIYLEPLAALLSNQCGRPVQLAMSRQDVFEATGPTSATRSRAKIGAKRDGTLMAAEVHLGFEAGAFPGAPVPGAARCALAPYDLPHHYVEGYEVVVNKPKVAAYRAPGAPQAEFAVESVIDEIAEQLGMDPLELRLKNAARAGSRRSEGVPHGEIGTEEVLRAALDSAHYRSELQGEHVGRGVASGFWFNGGNESSAYASVNGDGSVSLVLGSVDIGGQRAGLAIQFAETLGIPYEGVRPRVVDTDSVGFTAATGGSRTAFASGWAVHEAALDLCRQLEERAARIWDVERDQVHYENGAVHGPDGQSMTFKEIAGRLSETGGLIQGRADVKPTGVGAALATHVCDVEVDPDTGKVQVLRYTAVQDVGCAVHPSYVEGQIQGGVAQGVGMVLNEGYLYNEDGVMVNSSFLDYRMPVANDLPELETILVEVPNPGHPFGVRGVGEVPIVPPLAAVANAIYDAIGVRVRDLPASPAVLLEAMEGAQAE